MADRFAPPQMTVITGASGWLGRALVDRMLSDPSRPQLRLLAHTTAEARALNDLASKGQTSIDVVIGDIAKADTAARLLHGTGSDVDVIHTAGIIHPTATRQFFEVNTNGSRNVAQAALDHGVRRMVHVSSNSPFGTNPRPSDTFRAVEPYHPYYAYGRSKMLAELAVADAVGAVQAAISERPDICLLDVRMPGSDGSSPAGMSRSNWSSTVRSCPPRR